MPNSSQVPWDLAACPSCGGALNTDNKEAVCKSCKEMYPVHKEGCLDLRLRKPRRISLEFDLGKPMFPNGEPDFSPLRINPRPEVDFRDIELPIHLSREMASHLPKAPRTDSVCLDLGCGSGIYRGLLEHAGYRWVGVDYGDQRAPILADAHVLPFCANTFDLVVSLAVLEHIRYPHVMVNEVNRVLRPGGVFFGSVTYLVPFHMDSFYNMTHLGTYSVLQHAGFQVEKVASDSRYLGIRALSFTGLFLGAPRRFAYAAVLPLVALHRLWWLLAMRLRPHEGERLLHNTGAFMFIARKPRDVDRHLKKSD
jgi:SAM-dependent methyltransferase